MTIDETYTFSSFGLSDALLKAIERKGWTSPSTIQAIALPRLLADEGHCIVKARTGTGKTAAFGIPLIERLTMACQSPRALILAPTRELALQVSKEISSLVFGNFPRVTAVYGGASIRTQIMDLRRGSEIVVGTPGRVMDLMERKALDLADVDWFILDEADEMLDMGFFEDVEKILAAVKTEGRERPLHIALFSATMPEPILKVVRRHIGDAEIIVDTAPEDEKPLVDQFCILVRREDKLEALRRIIDSSSEFYGLIFCATKAETDELARRLVEAGYPAEAIHGDLSQDVRERTLRRFRLHRAAPGGEPAILVATDVAARGIDIEHLSHVVNWDLPNDRETYVHRIGRTGRAGRRGIAISLSTMADRRRVHMLSKMMEKNVGSAILWLKVPSVKSVMKALRKRISAAAVAALPGFNLEEAELPPGEVPLAEAEVRSDEAKPIAVADEVPAVEGGAPVTEAEAPAESDEAPWMARERPAVAAKAEAVPEVPAKTAAAKADLDEEGGTVSPFLTKVCRNLIDRLGAEKAVEALVTMSYGRLLDPARYGPITEFSEEDFNDPGRPAFRGRDDRGGRFSRGGPGRYSDEGRGYRDSGRPGGRAAFGNDRRAPQTARRGPGRSHDSTGMADFVRLYIGQGRQHGLGARDIAGLLMQAGGVPGRLVDEIEMKDFCSFATLPAEAARRACAFSKREPNQPVIRNARPAGGEG